jgi:hypothetical protein
MISSDLIEITAIFKEIKINSSSFKSLIGYRILTTSNLGNNYHLNTLQQRNSNQYEYKIQQLQEKLYVLLFDFDIDVRKYKILQHSQINVNTLNANRYLVSNYITASSLFRESNLFEKTIYSNQKFW